MHYPQYPLTSEAQKFGNSFNVDIGPAGSKYRY